MASQSQIAGQYFFLLIGAKSIGVDATSPWVLTVGIAWIVILTYICYRGIQVSARLQVTLLAVEIFMLLLLAVVALVRVGIGHAPTGHAAFSWSWLNPAHSASPSVFMAGMLLMVFVYWGWDTTTSINEETAEPDRIPGVAGVVSTLILLGTYFVVILSVQMFAGFGSSGIGLNNSNNVNDVLSPMGEAVFGGGAVGQVLSRLLLLMVLSSAAATTQTTILPTARRPCQADSVSSSRSASGKAASARSTARRSDTSSAMSGATPEPHDESSAARDSCRAAARNSLPITFRAVTSSQGSGSSGNSFSLRQATRNTSLTTSSANWRPARLTA